LYRQVYGVFITESLKAGCFGGLCCVALSVVSC